MKRGFMSLSKQDYLKLGYFETALLAYTDDVMMEHAQEMSKHNVRGGRRA